MTLAGIPVVFAHPLEKVKLALNGAGHVAASLGTLTSGYQVDQHLHKFDYEQLHLEVCRSPPKNDESDIKLPAKSNE